MKEYPTVTFERPKLEELKAFELERDEREANNSAQRQALLLNSAVEWAMAMGAEIDVNNNGMRLNGQFAPIGAIVIVYKKAMGI